MDPKGKGYVPLKVDPQLVVDKIVSEGPEYIIQSRMTPPTRYTSQVSDAGVGTSGTGGGTMGV